MVGEARTEESVDISWQEAWPDRETIRAEVEAFVGVVHDVLTETIEQGTLRCLYYKGSAVKVWDSALDYVPEISDVNFRVWLKSDEDVDAAFGSLGLAFEVQRKLERVYLDRVVPPVHYPRPEFVIMNKLVADPDYAPPAPHLVRVLSDEPSPSATYDEVATLQTDCKMALSQTAYVRKLPSSVIDKPGRLVWDSLRNLCFWVSSAGPRALHLLGAPAEIAWEGNRTRIHSEFLQLGQTGLVDAYAEYYLSGWAYFLSDWRDTDAGRRAIRSGVEVLMMTADVARQWLAEQDSG